MFLIFLVLVNDDNPAKHDKLQWIYIYFLINVRAAAEGTILINLNKK